MRTGTAIHLDMGMTTVTRTTTTPMAPRKKRQPPCPPAC